MIFRWGFILSSRTSRQRLLSKFFYLKACEESGGGIIVAGKVGRDFKSNVSGFIKDFFVLKVEIDLRELIRKKLGRGLCERDFGHDLFHGKDIDYNVMSQKIVYVSGL